MKNSKEALKKQADARFKKDERFEKARRQCWNMTPDKHSARQFRHALASARISLAQSIRRNGPISTGGNVAGSGSASTRARIFAAT